MITNLSLYNFRNFAEKEITFDPYFNIIHGNNGVGKTSILEAIYIASTGRSFRSRDIESIIKNNQQEMFINLSITSHDSVDYISIKKSISDGSNVKINQQPCRKSSHLAKLLPVNLIYQDIFEFIDSSPTNRRNLLDWGVFHVEPESCNWFKQYDIALKNRNKLLATGAPYSEHLPWCQQLSDLSIKINAVRKTYFDSLKTEFLETLRNIIEQEIDIEIEYYQGWEGNLFELLNKNFFYDKKLGYTKYGSHSADIIFSVKSKKAKYILSRGQKKIVLLALKLAQNKFMVNKCVILIDDIFSEFDYLYSQKLINFLKQYSQQIIITCHDKKQWMKFSNDSRDRLIHL